jgi:arsenate reductase-like glutaredoxin family protein
VLLQAGVSFAERDLIRQPLTEVEIRELLDGQPAALLYARRGRQNKALGIDPDRLTDEEMIAYMAREPTLIRRPTLVIDGEIIVGPSSAKLEEVVQSLKAEHGATLS